MLSFRNTEYLPTLYGYPFSIRRHICNFHFQFRILLSDIFCLYRVSRHHCNLSLCKLHRQVFSRQISRLTADDSFIRHTPHQFIRCPAVRRSQILCISSHAPEHRKKCIDTFLTFQCRLDISIDSILCQCPGSLIELLPGRRHRQSCFPQHLCIIDQSHTIYPYRKTHDLISHRTRLQCFRHIFLNSIHPVTEIYKRLCVLKKQKI